MPSAEHRIGLVPCPLCKDIPFRTRGCTACDGRGRMPVDEAIRIGLGLSDTEREMMAATVEPPKTDT